MNYFIRFPVDIFTSQKISLTHRHMRHNAKFSYFLIICSALHSSFYIFYPQQSMNWVGLTNKALGVWVTKYEFVSLTWARHSSLGDPASSSWLSSERWERCLTSSAIFLRPMSFVWGWQRTVKDWENGKCIVRAPRVW